MMPWERLQAWEACHELYLAVYRISETWPARERYGLTAQVRRAALSVGSDIAEGSLKRSPRDFARFLDMALGSLSELAYQLRAARDVGILPETGYAEVSETLQRAGRLTWGLYRGVRRRVEGRKVGR
jgi:four helix bundle protein